MLAPLWKDFEYQPHQIEGVEWMTMCEDVFPHGGILCDEMGLGKTIQMLALMKVNKVKTSLLVAPLCTLDQWQQTAERCGFNVWRAHATESCWEMPKKFKPSAVQMYLVNYERIVARPLLVNRREWDRIIYDEAHRLGSRKSKSYALASQLNSSHVWLLTATPVVNDEENAKALFELVGYEKVSARLESMQPMIEAAVLCRRMADLRSTIPALPKPAKEVNHILDFKSPEEEDIYRGIQGVIQRQWQATEMEAGGAASAEQFRLIMNLRQLSIHPQVYIAARKRQWIHYKRPDYLLPSTKFQKLRSLIETDFESHRWIVFCHFHEEMRMLKEYLDESPVVSSCHMYNGAMNMNEKREALEASKAPLSAHQHEVLLVQLQSGGTGLNLQHCDRIVFMGPWWTAALMDQAIGRAVRIGQKNQVIVHNLVLREETTMNIDKMMLAAADGKRNLCAKFLEIAMKKNKKATSPKVAQELP